MSDKKISQLTASTTPLAGTEVLPIVQNGATKRVDVYDLTAGRFVDMAGLSSSIGENGGISGPPTGEWAAKIIANQDAQFYSGLSVQTRWANPDTPIFEAAGGWNGSANGYYPVFTIDGLGQVTGKNLSTGNTTFTFASSGNLTLSTGNLVIGTAGNGIDFSADSSAAGMTSELLDDYEEGTWTPTFASSSGSFTSITYDAAVTGAKYTKIGNAVYIQGSIRTSAITVGTASGNLLITGLPFAGVANATGQDGSASGTVSQASAWADNTPSALSLSASQITLFQRLTSNGASAITQVSDAGTGSAANLIRFSCMYLTA